jgi:hypothetical protein
MDVASAFLNGKFEEELYMQQIPGYKDGTNCVLPIKGSLYGLWQAPQIWEKAFFDKVLGIGFTRFPLDSSVYIQEKDGVKVILAVYVDNIAILNQ